MCMIDNADGKWDALEPLHMVVARKAHRCGECQRVIQSGEQYERGAFADDYGISTVKTCAHCVAVRSWLDVQCDGFLFQGVLEDLEEHWQDDTLLHGRYLALAIAGMRKRWARADGTPMRVMGTYKKPLVAVSVDKQEG